MGKTSNKTPKPSGFSLTRNGNQFTLTWKIKAKNSNDGQKIRYMDDDPKIVKKKKQWTVKSIGKKATKYTITDKEGNIKWIKMQVQCDQKKDGKKVKNLKPSDWAGAEFKFKAPPKSTASLTLDSTNANVCNLSWGHAGNAFSKSDHYGYIRTERSTTFHSENEKDKWSKWEKCGEYGSIPVNDHSIYTNNSIYGYVRKYKFRILGKYGWNAKNGSVTVSHYYANPNAATIQTANISKNKSGGMTCYVQWVSPNPTYHPVDYSFCQYSILVPGEGMSFPGGATWTDRPQIKDNSGEGESDSDNFSIDGIIGNDQCLFVRVVNYHDNNPAFSAPKLATGIVTSLSTPSNLNIQTNFETYRISFSANNESEVPDAKLAVVLHTTKGSNKNDIVLDVISKDDILPVTIQCPNLNDYDTWSFGTYAFVGNYSYSTAYFTVGEEEYSYNIYNINNVKMQSATLWPGGDVPKAPANVVTTPVREGVALVTWDWPWESADISEVSWSDHADAWDSTDPPETYRLDNTRTGKLYIYGLEAGKMWYVRVRLIKLVTSGENPGPWSAAESVDMSMAPNKPVLECSRASVSYTDTFTLSWKYESGDGTDQKDATLKEVVFDDDGNVVIGRDIETGLGTSRSIDYTPEALKWNVGETHGFALTVLSESNKTSDVSEPVFIAVADPLKCEITSTSLTNRKIYAEETELQDSDDVHFTLVGTPVADPDPDYISSYYELDNGVYVSTDDTVIDSENTYYTVENTGFVRYLYELTSDSSVDPEKSYYSLLGFPVTGPVISDISTYYEITDTLYALSNDAVVDVSKTYYSKNGSVYTPISNPEYSLTSDTLIIAGKSYYTRAGDGSPEKPYVFISVDTSNYEYILTQDLAPVEGKEYYTRTGQGTEASPYVYTKVSEPSSASMSTYYEIRYYAYVLTKDTSVVSGKTYYTRTGEGTDESPYIYTIVADPSDEFITTYYEKIIDPSSADFYEDVVNPTLYSYYEFVDYIYSLTEDVSIDDTKTYYNVLGSIIDEPATANIGVYYERTDNYDPSVHYYSYGEINILRKLPLTVGSTVTGGLGGQYSANVSIVRAAPYFVDRPDETVYSGYEGEVVYADNYDDVSSISIAQTDLAGFLDDSALYYLNVYVYDELGQESSASVLFMVDWEHQAPTPDATVEFDSEHSVVKITPSIDASKYQEGDTFDIYRLSADKPTLIVKGGTYNSETGIGQTFVDPYPTIGDFGGHRVVTVTANGDFISNDEDSDMAWVDLDEEDGDIFRNDFSIINCDGDVFEILYNADLSTNWTKDFKETRYLGGHIQGDWNAGVHKDSTINSVVVRNEDQDAVRLFRRLAEYPGLCHVRTLDGSNYYADVQVSETVPSDDNPLNSYSFKITRVESDGYDGILLSEWNNLIGG